MITNLFQEPHNNPVKKTFNAIECLSAVGKYYPSIFFTYWESLRHYLDIVFNLEDSGRISGLKLLEEWFSNYGTAAIVNKIQIKDCLFELEGMKDFLNKYIFYFANLN